MAKRILNFVRYRFLLFAGLLPYFLGAAVSYYDTGNFDFGLFVIGLAGLFFVLVGVEAFNEYFDWILGTDRVFQINPRPITKKKFYTGVAAFFVALIFAVYLTTKVGTGIAIFAVIGFIAAAGYLGPPIRFTYRGLGEIVIALSYGPFMVLGSYYLQTTEFSMTPLLVSIIPAIMLFEIAIMNEVPDFLQDGLVGKKNLCVRLGRETIVKLYGLLMLLVFLACAAGIIAGIFPKAVWLTMILAPLAYRNYNTARRSYETPQLFLAAVRGTIIFYLAVTIIFILAFLYI